MRFGSRIVVSVLAGAGLLAQPAFETGRAREVLRELRARAVVAKGAAEQKSGTKKDAARKPARGAVSGGPMAVLSPDTGQGKAGGGVQKCQDTQGLAALWAGFVQPAERSIFEVRLDGERGRLHRPPHLAQAPPRARPVA